MDSAQKQRRYEQQKDYKRRRYRDDPEIREALKVKSRLQYKREPDRYHARSIRRRYGLSSDQYAEMLAAQGGKCLICDNPPKTERTGRWRLAVDHDHETGRVRGLLCIGCNAYLGWYEKHSRAVQEYLGGA